MKTLIMLSSALAIAGFAIYHQELRARARNEFHFVEYQGVAYKVLLYGFPFQVKDTGADVVDSVSPSAHHTTVRIAANFVFFGFVSFAGLQLSWLVYRWIRFRRQLRIYLEHS